jgi:glycine/D-amino acid oxidase-like deaminating enzyme
VPTYVERDTPEARLLETFPPVNRLLRPAEHPFPAENMLRYDTMYVETGRYLRQMVRDVRIAGGRFEVRRFASPTELAALPEKLIFNCTGLGSRELFGDTELRPARGQLAILEPQPEVQYAATGSFGYMFPRPDGILLGGTFELDEWKAVTEPKAIAEILASQKAFFDSFRCVA